MTVAVGCAANPADYQQDPGDARDAPRSRALSRKAAELLATDPVAAEELLREALAADLFNGPAHNNLGVVYLSRGELYNAAAEFEWARKLMPGHPDPRLNLALTLERGGHISEALETFDAALDVQPGHLPTIMGLVRAQIRFGATDARTVELLRSVALRGDDVWRDWARQQLLRLGEPLNAAGV